MLLPLSKKCSLIHLERLLLHKRNLLAQFQNSVLPVALGVEPRERRREGGSSQRRAIHAE